MGGADLVSASAAHEAEISGPWRYSCNRCRVIASHRPDEAGVLNLSNTQVTDDAVKYLKMSLPGAVIGQ